jgi:hypothetical protein
MEVGIVDIEGATYMIYNDYNMQIMEVEYNKEKENNKFIKGHYDLKEAGVI